MQFEFAEWLPLTVSLARLRTEEAKILSLEGILMSTDSLPLLGLTLSGKGGVINLEVIGAFQDTEISGYKISSVDFDDITGDEFLRVFEVLGSVTEDHDLGGEHVREGLHQIRTLLVLEETEDSGDEDDETEDDTEVKVIHLFLKPESDKAEDSSEPQEQGEEAGELLLWWCGVC